jgi:L-ascorbate metabolism protein UlaG (beta-lactamase superfamily)
MAFGKTGVRAALILAGATAALVSGCFSRRNVKPPGDPEKGVTVQWHGHSCFRVEDSAARVFLLDPFDETVGYKPPDVKADAVLVTHDHFDHNRVPPGRFEVLTATGVHTVAGVEVTGISAFHDEVKGERHGPTRLYVWEMGGVRVAHLGDIGQDRLEPEQKELLGAVDVLFIPTGGKTTVDGGRAARMAKEIGARVVVPMHYGNEQVRMFPFDPVDPFLKEFGRVERLAWKTFSVSKGTLPDQPTVFVPALPGRD